jgi:type II secretory pathway pseudopilin PulG
MDSLRRIQNNESNNTKGHKMRREKKNKGFTIVELLTVMSVIMILIGLLVPALNLVRKMATETKQRAQFHSISVALEFFSGENDGYPESTELGTTNYTVGAQHLAEALVGRDLQGYDTASSWDAEADASATNPPYGGLGTSVDIAASLDRRRGPYLTVENVESCQVGQLYDNPGKVYDGSTTSAPVLTDVYRVRFITATAGTVNRQLKVGSPVLYYKANTASRIFDSTQPPADNIYNIEDNEELVALGKVTAESTEHPIDNINDSNGINNFYDMITNPNVTNVNMFRPYNQNTYILISAGFDGIYGTRDDITNFGE